MDLKEVKEQLLEKGLEDTVMLENPSYETAIIGYTESGRLAYSYEKMVEYLCENEGMDPEEALDFVSYNTLRSIPYMGDSKPIVIFDFEQ